MKDALANVVGKLASATAVFWVLLVVAFLGAALQAVPEVFAHLFKGHPINSPSAGAVLVLLGFLSGWANKTNESETVGAQAAGSRLVLWFCVVSTLAVGAIVTYYTVDWNSPQLIRATLEAASRILITVFLWVIVVATPLWGSHVVAESRRLKIPMA